MSRGRVLSLDDQRPLWSLFFPGSGAVRVYLCLNRCMYAQLLGFLCMYQQSKNYNNKLAALRSLCLQF